MATVLNPYLSFDGDALEAMTFYGSALGGEVTTSAFGDMGVGGPDEAHKIMHAQLETPDGLTLMGADTPNGMTFERGTPQVSLSGGPEDEAMLRQRWTALSDGAHILEELATAPWGDTFGMLVDRHGVQWMVNIAGAPQGGAVGA